MTQWQFWGKRSIRVLSIQGLLRITPNQPEPPSIPSRLTPESPLLASRTRPKRARRNRHLCGPSTSATSAEIGNRNDDDTPLAPMNTLLYSGDCTLLMLSCERAWASRRFQRERKQQRRMPVAQGPGRRVRSIAMCISTCVYWRTFWEHSGLWKKFFLLGGGGI